MPGLQIFKSFIYPQKFRKREGIVGITKTSYLLIYCTPPDV